MVYDFTNNWFDQYAKNVWNNLVPQAKPQKILEVGSYEGASACFLIEALSNENEIEIHCVDTWEGSIENFPDGVPNVNMRNVESRFDHNVKLAISKVEKPVNLVKHKSFSDVSLSKMIGDGKKQYFDFVYIDGSHQAPDVLCDAVLAFRLLKTGGIMVFDDYLWAENLPYGFDPIRCPKLAIDSFVNIYFRKLKVLQAPLYQLYIQKISD
ncbi:MAG: class I SAM-dependent methyltransferase [Acidocella sp.]|nr:class I SAM-dependent methyltransferase [Acidocella sp.]